MFQYNNKTVLRKITDVISGNKINTIVKKYNSDYRAQSFYTKSHILSMIYLNLSNTKSLHGLVEKLENTPKLQEMVNTVSVSQLSRKNAKRDCRVFEDLFYETVNIAKKKLGLINISKYFKEIKAIDATVIQIATKLAPNLYYENGKSGMKISTLLNVSQGLPERIEIVHAKINDRKCINNFITDKNTLYLFDRGYFDYKKYDELTDNGYKFITRQVSNACVEEVKSTYVNNDLIFDIEVTLGTEYSKNKTHNTFREILTFDENDEEFRIITNIFDIPAEEILELYRIRWKIEIFFKWIKQNLRIKEWLGRNENAIKIQIYAALITYILLQLFKLSLPKSISMLKLIRIIQSNLIEEIASIPILSG